jgi:hypothetical protein
MKQRSHQFVINVTFNKPCTRALALRELRDDGGIDAGGGVHYTTQREDHEPETFKVRSIRPIPSHNPWRYVRPH